MKAAERRHERERDALYSLLYLNGSRSQRGSETCGGGGLISKRHGLQ